MARGRSGRSGGPSSSFLSSGTTSTVGTTSSITGIPDRKSQLLEQARIQREQRREVARRNGAAKNIQRVYRAWTCRVSVVAENSIISSANSVENDGAMALRKGPTDTGTLRGPYDRLVGELLGGAVDQRQQQLQAAVVEATSLLSLLLSPTLLPVLVRRQRKMQPDTASKTVVTDTDIVLGYLVLLYARIVEKIGGGAYE